MAKVTISGADLKRFFNDATIWGPNDGTVTVDDDSYEVNGTDVPGDDFDPESVDDTASVTVLSGYLTNPPRGVDEEFTKAIKQWQRKQSMRRIVAEIPATKLDEFVAAVKALGGKVIV